MSLPAERWQESLSEMEAALANAIRSLDRAEERWERAFAPSAGEGEAPAALGRLDSRVQEWEGRLQEAERLTAAAEAELAEKAVAVSGWLALFAKWEELLKQRDHMEEGVAGGTLGSPS
jgi:hypothetical protein